MWDYLPSSALQPQPESGERLMKVLPCSSGPYMVAAGVKTTTGWASLVQVGTSSELARQWSRN